VHTPLTDETRAMINDTTLGLMKKGHLRQHLARPVQQERALFESLTRGHLRRPASTSSKEEPTSMDNPLFNLPNVVVSSTSPASRRRRGARPRCRWRRDAAGCAGEKPDVLVNPTCGASRQRG